MKTAEEIRSLLLEQWLHKIVGWEIQVISPWDVAESNGIKIYTGDLASILEGKFSVDPDDKISGAIFKDWDVYKIFVDEKDHANRKKFTIAHELGHYFLHRDYLDQEAWIIDTRDTILFRHGYSERETEANKFAAEYLMPFDDVREMYQKYPIVEVLANYYGVSRTAMAIRIDTVIWSCN